MTASKRFEVRAGICAVLAFALLAGASVPPSPARAEPARIHPSSHVFAQLSDRATSEAEAAGPADGVRPSGPMEALRAAMAAALGYVWELLGRTYDVTGLTELGGPFALASADRFARDAKDFVEARRKAEAEWRKALERADEAAREAARNAAREQKRSSMIGGASGIDQKRAEARKAELEQLKRDLDRRIAEGLAKLEALQNESAARQAEEARALAAEAERNAAEAMQAADEQRRAAAAAEEALKAAEAEATRKAADEMAARKADDERRAAEARAEAERKAAEEAAARKAEEERRAAEARAQAERKAAEEAAARKVEEERRQAEARAEVERKAAEEATARKVEEERRQADARAEAERKTTADAEARKAEETARHARAAALQQITDVRAAYERQLAAAERAQEAPPVATPLKSAEAGRAEPDKTAEQRKPSQQAPLSSPSAATSADPAAPLRDRAAADTRMAATRPDPDASAADVRVERRVVHRKKNLHRKKKAKCTKAVKPRMSKRKEAKAAWAHARRHVRRADHKAKKARARHERPRYRCRWRLFG